MKRGFKLYDKQYAEMNQLATSGQQQLQYIRPTRRQQLRDQRAMLVKQLDVIDEAIAALDAHPDLEKFAEALSRAGV